MKIIDLPKPNISPIARGDMFSIITRLMLVIASGLVSYIIAKYASERFKTDKKKTAFCYIAISVVMTALLLCFFGLSAITVRGIILTQIFLLSALEDCLKRECDDYLHVMIVIAGLIGTTLSDIPDMILSAILVFAVIVGTVLITNSGFGGADIKMATACAFLLGVRRGLLGLLTGLIFAVIVNMIKNRKNKKAGFPMIPYLAVGFMTAYFI